MTSLTSEELKCMIACDTFMRDKIIGVFPADQIKRLKVNEGLIINTKPFGDEGEHWISVYNAGDRMEVFDSLVEKSDTSMIDFHKLASNVYLNEISFQCHDSYVCGYYSIFFLFLRVRNISFQEFLNMFSPMCKMNYAFVLRFIKRTFSLCLTDHVG